MDKKMYEDYLQKMYENYRQKKKGKEDNEQWEEYVPGISKMDEDITLMILYASHLERGGDPPPKKIAKIIKEKHPDVKVPEILVDFLCDVVLGKKRKEGGKPVDPLKDFEMLKRNSKIIDEFKQMTSEGINVEKCYSDIGSTHNTSWQNVRNIVTDSNNRRKHFEEKYDMVPDKK